MNHFIDHTLDVVVPIIGIVLFTSPLVALWILIRRRRRWKTAHGGRGFIAWWFYQLKEKRIAELKRQGYTEEAIAEMNRDLEQAISGFMMVVLVVGGLFLMVVLTFTLPISLPVLAILWGRFFYQLKLLKSGS